LQPLAPVLVKTYGNLPLEQLVERWKEENFPEVF
jgi:hypothetical protein